MIYRPVLPGDFVQAPPIKRVLPGGGVQTPWRPVLPGRIVQVRSEPVDPLADYAFHVRLQTHMGDNVPLGMYQDVACTIPAVNDFDPVAAWRDEITGSVILFTNADPDQQPMLRFIGGVPVLATDGLDDVLVQPATAMLPLYIHARIHYISGGFGRVTTQTGSGNGGFTGSGGAWGARYSGTNIPLGAATAGYDSLFIQGGAGTSRTTYNGVSTPQPDDSLPNATWSIGDFTSGGGQVIEGNYVALYFGSTAIDAAQQTVLENYTANLAP